MAKIMISQTHVDQYPSLEKYLGQTVDASVFQRAVSDAKVNAADAKKAEARKAKTASAPSSAAKVPAKTPAAGAGKSSSKKRG